MNFAIESLTNPVVHFTALLLLVALFRVFKKPRVSNAILVILLFWSWLISSTPFSQMLLGSLEHEYRPLRVENISGDSVNILILGAGHSDAPTLPFLGQLVSTSVVRLTEGVRIKRQISGGRLVLSGNSPAKRTTQAEIAAQASLELGVDAKDTFQLRSPKSTEEEIKAYKKRFGVERPLILVTSAFHMPRAMRICKNAGLYALPAPTDYYNKADVLSQGFNYNPSVQKLQMLQIVLHEWGGMIKIDLSE